MNRAALLLSMLGLLGCAEQQATPVVQGPIHSHKATRNVHRSLLVLKEKSEDTRGSEQDAVTDDAPDPEAAKSFEQRMGQGAVALTATKEPPRVTAIRLDDTARGDAQGMVPAGDIYQANLGEGQRASMPLALAPGQCLTMIAIGGVGAIEVDLFLTAGSRIVAEDPGTGPIAVIGGHGKCFKVDKPLDATLNAVVRRGAGVVLVRLFQPAK